MLDDVNEYGVLPPLVKISQEDVSIVNFGDKKMFFLPLIYYVTIRAKFLPEQIIVSQLP